MKIEAEIIPAEDQNIELIVSRILENKICVVPFGKKQRRVFALVGLANDQVIRRLKRIKKRASSRAIGISGIPEVVPMVAKLNQTPALTVAAKRLGLTEQQIIEKCFEIGGVGLILVARDWLPKDTVMVNKNQVKTVLVAGEISDQNYDIFPKIYRQLIKNHQRIMVGTSANLEGDDTYHVLEQKEAYRKLKKHVDVFVYDKLKFGLFPLFKHLTSTTMLDLSINPPEVIRWGSVHPQRFKRIFPDLIFNPKRLKHYRGRERLHHLFLKSIAALFKN